MTSLRALSLCSFAFGLLLVVACGDDSGSTGTGTVPDLAVDSGVESDLEEACVAFYQAAAVCFSQPDTSEMICGPLDQSLDILRESAACREALTAAFRCQTVTDCEGEAPVCDAERDRVDTDCMTLEAP
ncbi:MAG: hypothetical protein AAF447_07495 [Myxococcota bacterium]